MISSWQTERLVTNQCPNCKRQSGAPAKFCRWCGTRCVRDSAAADTDPHNCSTTLLADQGERLDSFSSRSLNTVRQNVALRTAPLRLNRFGVLMIAALIAIPMWLLIILLSPVDAYMAAKDASSQMSIR